MATLSSVSSNILLMAQDSPQALASQRLRELMDDRRVSANRLAGRIGVPQTTLSRQLRLRSVPLDILEKAAAELGVEIAELLSDGSDEETPEQAVAQSDVEAEVERVFGIVRLVDGKD